MQTTQGLSKYLVDDVTSQLQKLYDQGAVVSKPDGSRSEHFAETFGRGFAIHRAFLPADRDDLAEQTQEAQETEDVHAGITVENALEEVDNWLQLIHPDVGGAIAREEARLVRQEKRALLMNDTWLCSGENAAGQKMPLLQYAATYGTFSSENKRGVRISALRAYLNAIGPYVLVQPNFMDRDTPDYLLTACQRDSEEMVCAFVDHYAAQLNYWRIWRREHHDAAYVNIERVAFAAKNEFDARIASAILYLTALPDRAKARKLLAYFNAHGDVQIMVNARNSNHVDSQGMSKSQGMMTIREYIAQQLAPYSNDDPDTIVTRFLAGADFASNPKGGQGTNVIGSDKINFFNLKSSAARPTSALGYMFAFAVVGVVVAAIVEGAMWDTKFMGHAFQDLDKFFGGNGERVSTGTKIGFLCATGVVAGEVVGGMGAGMIKLGQSCKRT